MGNDTKLHLQISDLEIIDRLYKIINYKDSHIKTIKNFLLHLKKAVMYSNTLIHIYFYSNRLKSKKILFRTYIRLKKNNKNKLELSDLEDENIYHIQDTIDYDFESLINYFESIAHPILIESAKLKIKKRVHLEPLKRNVL